MKSKLQTIFLVLFLFCAVFIPGHGALADTGSTDLQKSSDLYLLNLSSAARTGWQFLDGKWYYFDSNGVKKTGWQKIGGVWYYLSRWDNGAMLTGWQRLDGNWYYFASSGAMLTGWQYMDNKWFYLNSGGDMATGWRYLGNKWYYLSESDGAMLTGFQKIDDLIYYFHSSGDMATGWQAISGKWYYFSADGRQLTGWQRDGGKWYYLNGWDNGAMLTGFHKLDGQTYYFYPAGDMASEWTKIDGKWYYFNAGGCQLTGWQKIEDKWYYLNPWDKGAMLAGWHKLDGRWFYFYPSGDMADGFRILDGKAYYFGSDGGLQEDWASRNVIVIDPGHSSEIPGGKVPIGPGSDKTADADNYGAVSITNGLHEYELVLDVSLLLRDRLEARGYKVIMVRTTNSGAYSCVDRAGVANDANAAIFLRVHANQAPKDHSKNGAMTICITGENEFIPQMYKKSRLLSDLVLKNYISAVGCYNEGVWERDDLIANNWSKVPTTLIELGYMSNSKEDQLMQTSDYQEKMVTGMVNGIDAYFSATAR